MVSRLNAGLAKIEAGRVAGEDVTYWEDFWCELLRRYERTYDALQELGGG